MSDYIAKKIAKGEYTLSPRRKGKSFIWNVLSEILDEEESIVESWVYCRSCSKILKYSGTQLSNLGRHKCCVALKQPVVLKTIAPEDKVQALEACTAWMIKDCRPFSAICGPGFEKLIQFFVKMGALHGENIDITTLLPDPASISSKLQKIADDTKKKFKREIIDVVNSGCASATIHMWCDNYIKRNLLGVTFHYQCDSKLFHIVLGMKSMDFESSTGDDIVNKLNSLFGEFGVKNIRPITFVTDQEANIVKALSHNTRLNCSSHLFSSVLKKSFQETAEIEELLQSCKEMLKFLKKENLEDVLPTLLKSECPSRWNSNYATLTSVLDNWFEINDLLNENKEGQRLLGINIPTLKCLVELCGDFQVVFNKLQLCSAPSLCFVIPSINKIKAICARNQGDIAAISHFKANVLKNVDQIWVPNLSMWHKAAFFLYPPAVSLQQREVNDIKEFCITKMKDSADAPTASNSQAAFHISAIYSTASIKLQPPSPDPSSHFSSSPNSPSTSYENISCSAMTSAAPSPPPNADNGFFFPELLKEAVMTTPETSSQEVERYSSNTVPMTQDFDLLEWWRLNSHLYPKLSKFALQVHSIPASSAAAEQAFSLAGNIMTDKRNSLGPKTVDNMIFLHSFNKNSKS